ncbi:MAG: methyltransferase domain-containing protein [Simkaniaceae bacterium]|nr:methyltransferase domain-containing protein [Simkaniaceae bacterium]
MQRRWAIAFLAPHLKRFHGNEHILDLGCGDGKISADISRFLPTGHVTAIDPSKDMISWAKRQFCDFEYSNLTFALGGFEETNLSKEFDCIISLNALHHCNDKKRGLEEAHRLLKDQGKLLILVPSSKESAWDEAIAAICSIEKWSQHLEKIAETVFLDSGEYANLLETCQFTVISVKDIKTKDPFVDKEEFVSWLVGTYPPIVKRELLTDFFSDIVDQYIAIYPDAIDANGTISAEFDAIQIVAVKR